MQFAIRSHGFPMTEALREHAERRQSEYRDAAKHEPPADRWIGEIEAADLVDLLRAGLLHRMTDDEEDRRLGQAVHHHVQKPGEIRQRTADAESDDDDAHVLDRRIGEQPFDVAAPIQHEGGKELFRRDNKFALFNKEGDMIESNSTRKLGNVGDTVRAQTDTFARNDYNTPSDMDVVAAITEVAKKRGVPNVQVAMAWLLAQPGVTSPIFGATKMSHMDDAVASLSIKLDADELKSLAAPYQPHRVLSNA
mgnify:CR=1 FL=1